MTQPTAPETNALEAKTLDQKDPLRAFRSGFYFPKNDDGSDKLYFCGNSLGLQHQSVASAVEEVMSSWKNRAVDGHFKGDRPWLTYHERLREGQAALTGASPEEIITMNALTINLHLAMVSFYRPEGQRRRILMEKQSFPSDRYAVESQIRFHGLDPSDCLVELEPENGERLIEEERIKSYLREHGETVALVLWPGVQYATGQVFDLTGIASAARSAGANVGFDLAHSMGNVPVNLSESECDFAVWCTYKYLNAGPGSTAGMFVHARHSGRSDLPRFHGWYGNDRATRFKMAAEFVPAAGAAAWQISNPAILPMAPLLASLDVFQQAGFDRLRQKSIAMTGWLADKVTHQLGDVLEIITPAEAHRRGCQLSLRVRAGRETGRALFENLDALGVVPDWREPDVIRVAPVPLYNSFEDCARLVNLIRQWADKG